LPRFSTVDLVIGAGPQRNITIPNVVGLTVQEAKAIIKQNLFEIGLVEYEDGNGDESDIVYYQDPAPGDVRDQGMQIDIWASKKTPAEMGKKISELNSLYRIKIDMNAPVYIDEGADYIPPAPQRREPSQDVPRPTIPAETTPKVETPKPSTETKPKATDTKTTTPKTSPPKTEEKAKAKKVVVE
jgi:serine/threonine-protein kinase